LHRCFEVGGAKLHNPRAPEYFALAHPRALMTKFLPPTSFHFASHAGSHSIGAKLKHFALSDPQTPREFQRHRAALAHKTRHDFV
jgi:hypothetical protein